MYQLSRQESVRIANVGFICAVLVVMIHCPSANTAGIRIFRGVFPGCFMSIVNAWFFLVAGYFFVGSYGKEGWWGSAIVKRIRSLVVPYVSLNILFFVFLALYQWPNVRYPVWGESSLWLGFARAMGFSIENPVDGPLWFVRSLFLYMLMTPLMMPLLGKKNTAIATCVILFLCNCLDLWFMSGAVVTKIIRPQWIVFYASGICIHLYGMPTVSKRNAIVMLSIGIVMSMCVPMDRQLISNSHIRCVLDWINRPLIMAGIFALMTERPFPKFLTSNAFPIYIIHWQIIICAYIVADRLHCHAYVFGNPLYCILFIISTVFIVIAIAQVCKRSKILTTLLFGGRG